MAENFGAKFTLDVSEFKRSLAQVNAGIRESQSSFKAAAAGINDFETSENGLKTKLSELNNVADKQREKVELLKARYAQLKSEGADPSSTAMLNLKDQINKATAALNTTEAEVKETEQALNSLGDSADEAGDSMSEAGSGGVSALAVALGNLVSSAISKAVGAIKDLAKEALTASDSLYKFEQTMSFAGFDDAEIKRVEKEMKDYADKTVYDLETVMNTTAQLGANGVKDFATLTQAAGNLNAVAGGNKDTFSSVALVLTQTAGAGKLTTENYKQLANAIPGATGKLQEALKNAGAYTGDFSEAMKNGEITAEEFNAAIITLGSEPVAVEAAQSVSTFEGAVGQLKSAVIDGFMKIYDTVGMENITGVITSITDKVGEIMPMISEGVGWIMDNLPAVTALMGGLTAAIIAQTVATKLKTIADTAGGGATGLLTAAQHGLNAALNANPIGIIITLIGALVAAFLYCWNNVDGFKEFFINAWEKIKEFVGNAIDAIKVFFTETLPNAVTDMINKIKALPQNIKKIITDAWNAVKQWASDMWNKAKETGKNFFDGIVNFFKELPGNIKNFISSIWENIKTWAGDMTGKAKETGKGFLDGVIDFVKNLPGELLKLYVTMIANLAAWAIDLVTGGKGAGKDFVQGIVDFVLNLPGKIKDFLDKAFTNVKTWASDLWSKAKEAGKNFVDGIKEFFEQLPEKVKGFLGKVFTETGTWVINMVNKAKEVGRDFINGVVNFFTQLPGKVKTEIDGTLTKVKTWVTDMVNKAKEVGRDFLNGIVNFFTQLPGKVKSFIDDTLNKIKTWGKDTGDKAKETGKGFIDGIVDFIKNLPAKVKEFLDGAITKTGQFVIDIVNKAKQAGRDFLNGIINFLSSLPGDVGKKLADVITKVTSWVSDFAAKGTAAARDFFNNIINGLKQLPEKIKEIGKNLVEGIWSGITGKSGWLNEKIGGFAKSTTKNAKDKFQIKSPSRIFRDQIGKNLALGIGEGFTDAFPSVEHMIDKAINGFIGDLPEVKSRVGGSVAGLNAGGYTSAINGQGAAAAQKSPAAGAPSVTVNQTNNYAASHTQYEIFKSRQEAAAAVKMALAGAAAV